LVKASKIYVANSGSGADWLFFRKKKLAGKKDKVPPAIDLGRGGKWQQICCSSGGSSIGS
jgi:hypothetical protein